MPQSLPPLQLEFLFFQFQWTKIQINNTKLWQQSYTCHIHYFSEPRVLELICSILKNQSARKLTGNVIYYQFLSHDRFQNCPASLCWTALKKVDRLLKTFFFKRETFKNLKKRLKICESSVRPWPSFCTIFHSRSFLFRMHFNSKCRTS